VNGQNTITITDTLQGNAIYQTDSLQFTSTTGQLILTEQTIQNKTLTLTIKDNTPLDGGDFIITYKAKITESTSQQAQSSMQVANNALYITFSKTLSNTIKLKAQQQLNIQITQPFLFLNITNTYKIMFNPTTTTKEQITLFFQNETPDYHPQIESVPVFTTAQANKSSPTPRHIQAINRDSVNACQSQSSSIIKIAIIDNGLDTKDTFSHQKIQGYDVADQDDDISIPFYTPERSHGTIATSIMAAQPNSKA